MRKAIIAIAALLALLMSTAVPAAATETFFVGGSATKADEDVPQDVMHKFIDPFFELDPGAFITEWKYANGTPGGLLDLIQQK